MRLAAVILACAALSCGPAPWVDYRSDEAGFKAAFPGAPTHTVKKVNTIEGPSDMQMYAQGILDGARDGAVANTQGKLLSETIIEMGGHPGRELKIEVAGGKATIRARVYLIRDRLFQSIVVTPVNDAYAPSVGRFLDSVELL